MTSVWTACLLTLFNLKIVAWGADSRGSMFVLRSNPTNKQSHGYPTFHFSRVGVGWVPTWLST
ncbi:MAG: hypothetical protein ACO2Y2_01245, partial [Poseidonia sp.]